MSQLIIHKSLPATAQLYLFIKELFRKAVHASVAIIALVAQYNLYLGFAILALGSSFYLVCEFIRLKGYKVPVISTLTSFASRSRDKGSIVWGPVTLALGAMLALALFPPVIANIAILSLAFGDGIASLVGKACGYHRPSFLMGKSIEGSLACFIATFFAIYSLTSYALLALVIAVTSMVTEALPLKNLDNIAIPLTTGSVALLFLLIV